MRTHSLALGWATVVLVSQAAMAAPDAIKVGDPAPPLTVQWLKDQPASGFDKGRLYVVEFSATWCPTCRKDILHMTDLAKRHAGKVTLVSVYASEEHDEKDSKDLGYVDQVKYLLKTMGSKMEFPVAIDVQQKTTAQAWKTVGVPMAYVIDRTGHVAWVGQPAGLDAVLLKMEAGTFQVAQAANDQNAMNAAIDRVYQLKRDGKRQAALTQINELIAKRGDTYTKLYLIKYGVLAGYDDAQADALLKWLLKADIPGFDWDHLVSMTYTASQHPNYQLALATVDRALAKAETKLATAGLMVLKANMYLAQSFTAQNTPEKAQDLAHADALLEQAKATADSPGVPRKPRLDAALQGAHFKMLIASGDDVRATAMLRSELDDHRAREVDWMGYIDTAMKHQRSPDYPLLLAVADRALSESDDKFDQAYVLSHKSDVYAAQGDLDQALACCRQAVATAMADKDNGYVFLKEYQQKLAALQAKAKAAVARPAT